MLKTKVTRVEIPRDWEALDGGRFKVNIPYRESYGTVNIRTIPDCVVMIGSHVNNLVLYSDRMPMIPEGACLTFNSR